MIDVLKLRSNLGIHRALQDIMIFIFNHLDVIEVTYSLMQWCFGDCPMPSLTR
jgi:hypothetical protein